MEAIITMLAEQAQHIMTDEGMVQEMNRRCATEEERKEYLLVASIYAQIKYNGEDFFKVFGIQGYSFGFWIQ